MAGQSTSLGSFISELMRKHDHSNRSLAQVAGVSDTAIRNLLKFGVESGAKDPDARTLTLVAKALDVDALRLFRLAGYIPPLPSAHSVRADYIATVFDSLSPEKQDAVLSVLEAMADKSDHRSALEQMRADSKNPLAGLDLALPNLARLMANELIAHYQLSDPVQVESIPPDAKVLHYTWKDLPVSTQERVKALIRHKLSLDYDPTMVEPEWRE